MSGIRIALGVCLASPALLAAQPASFVYRLGRDTAAIEQFTRTPTEVAGEMVQRTGTTVARYRYRVTVGRTGRPTAASIRRLQPDGSDVPTGVRETRFTVTRDSIVRELVFADSVQRRAFAATDAMINFPTFIYGPTELLHALRTKRQPTDSLPALGAQGAMNHTGFTALGGDTLRLRGGPYAMLLRFDAQSRLLSLDGTNTTNKVLATRGAGGLDLQALAMAMAPTGVLSARETVRAAFGPGGIVIVDYGRPSVRGRTVWGGTLIPFDSVWRTGANDATHLFTSRTLTFGTVTLPPGAYTVWVQHTRTGTRLHLNSGVGQWGTQFDAARDLGTVPMELVPAPSPVEVLQLRVKALTPSSGELEVAWGDRVARAPFTVSVR